MPIRWDKLNSVYDTSEAKLRSMLGEPPSQDEIVDRVASEFASGLSRLLGDDDLAAANPTRTAARQRVRKGKDAA